MSRSTVDPASSPPFNSSNSSSSTLHSRPTRLSKDSSSTPTAAATAYNPIGSPTNVDMSYDRSNVLPPRVRARAGSETMASAGIVGGAVAQQPSAQAAFATHADAAAAVSAKLNPAFLAMSRLKRRRFSSCLSVCTSHLATTPLDTQVWYTKLRCLTQQAYIDDLEMEEEGAAEALMDENSMQKIARPGTSLKRPGTSAMAAGGNANAGVRPMSSAGRPLSGFARPGTQSRGGASSSAEDALRGARPGTTRPMSVAGRFMRLGTASLLTSDNGMFVDPARLNVDKYAGRQAEAKALTDYLLYVLQQPKKALDLAAAATTKAKYNDWWWKARLGKIYYRLGLYRDAERQFKSALAQQDSIAVSLELAKVYLKIDQPNTALEAYMRASEKFSGDVSLIVATARVYDSLGDSARALSHYKKALHYDASNAEAIACLAAHSFYSDSPEIALRFYRRLLQMGVHTTEIYTNLALCTFHAAQYDMCLSCFDKALQMADDDAAAEVWYNVGQLAIGIGDLNLAYQSFKIAISVDANHAESWNNLGILELRKGNIEQARSNFQSAASLAPHLFEPFFNRALVAFKLGDCQESFEMAQKALEAFPDHTDSKELIKQLKKHFTML